MKQQKMRWIALLLCAVLVCGIAGAAGDIITKGINVQYMGITLRINGQEVTPRDVNGNVVEPFVYNGTTYLPVRAVSSALGEDVEWDGDTRTVYIGWTPKNQGKELLEPYEVDWSDTYSGEESKTFSMMGTKYMYGVVHRDNYSYNPHSYYNLGKKYDSVEFDVGHIDNEDAADGTIFVYLDGKLTQEIKVSGDMMVEHFTIPTNYGQQLRIVTDTKGNGRYGIANVTGVR